MHKAPPITPISPSNLYMAVPPVRNKRERAEKACQLAEELFLAGDVDDAHTHAKSAKRLCPTLPGVDNALAAYEVHINAADAKRDGAYVWRAVLGIGAGAGADANAVKKQFRRLSLLVHPDKTQCAAAEGAFKLLREAHDEALAPPPPSPPPTSTSRATRTTHPPPAAAAAAKAGQAKPKVKVKVLLVMRPPVQERREPILIYCPSCENEFRGKVGPLERRKGMRCARCPAWLNRPWRTKPPTEKKPPAAPGRQVFQCPARCPGCGERYTSMVCVGRWCLQCKTCSMAAMVHVHGPYQATTSIKRSACNA